MGEIFVVVEHRQGEVREVTHQMLWKGNDLCEKHAHTLTAIVIGGKDEPFINEIAQYFELNYKTVYYHVMKLIVEGRLRQERGKLVVVGSEWIEPTHSHRIGFVFENRRW